MSEYVMHYEMKNPNFSSCRKSAYTAHIRTTKNQERVTCSRYLKRLNKTKSFNPLPFRCTLCGKTFESQEDLSKHQYYDCTGGW